MEGRRDPGSFVMSLAFIRTSLWHSSPSNDKKLSYRKQITHQLRTKYTKGIYSNYVTLKYGLEITQGH